MKFEHKNFIISIIIVIMTTMSISYVTADEGYDYEGHWAEEYITFLKNYGVLNGYENGDVKPDDVITRAEFVTLVNKIVPYTEYINTPNFSDVPDYTWYADEFKKARILGYLNGDDNNNAKPENNITRAEASVMVAKLLNLKDYDEVVFADYEVFPEWAVKYINAATRADIISGYPDTSFKPNNNITRAEACVIIYKLHDYFSEKMNVNPNATEPEYLTEPTTETTSTEIIVQNEGGIKFKDFVKELNNVLDYVVSGNEKTVTILEYTGNVSISSGDYIVLPATPDEPAGFAFHVDTVQIYGKEIVITGNIPDNMAEFIESINISGHVGAEINEETEKTYKTEEQNSDDITEEKAEKQEDDVPTEKLPATEQAPKFLPNIGKVTSPDLDGSYSYDEDEY